jgi:sulfoxide reductase heme-binding subunit YedZ
LNLTQQYRWIYKPLVFAACATPAVLMLLAAFGKGPMDLGADPVRRLIHACGITALNLLLIGLAVSPARQIPGLNSLVRLRRMLGLFAFFYVVAHFTVYLWLDQVLDLGAVGEDILKRPYITIGMAALLLLIPLAVTSTNGMMRRLGRRWTRLHRLVYVIAALALWHFWWQVKADISEPVFYVAIFVLLMAWRIKAKFWPATARERT